MSHPGTGKRSTRPKVARFTGSVKAGLAITPAAFLQAPFVLLHVVAPRDRHAGGYPPTETATMPLYLSKFSYTPETWARMVGMKYMMTFIDDFASLAFS